MRQSCELAPTDIHARVVAQFNKGDFVKRTVFTFATLFLISACSQESAVVTPKNKDQTLVAAPSKFESIEPTTLREVGDSTFNISPGSFLLCKAKDGAVIATAKWDVSSLGVKEVAIYVESPGNPRKLWLIGSHSGAESTGNWVFDQSRFTLIDRLSKKQLAQLAINAIPCP